MTTRLIPPRTDAAPPPVATIERDAGDFVVPAELLAEAFALPVEAVKDAMRARRMTARSEVGVGVDAGRFRLTFVHGDRLCRIIVDAEGHVLSRAVLPRRTP